MQATPRTKNSHSIGIWSLDSEYLQNIVCYWLDCHYVASWLFCVGYNQEKALQSREEERPLYRAKNRGIVAFLKIEHSVQDWERSETRLRRGCVLVKWVGYKSLVYISHCVFSIFNVLICVSKLWLWFCRWKISLSFMNKFLSNFFWALDSPIAIYDFTASHL